jgi:ATP-dependent RNA helicase DDX51/DBP6
MEARKRKREPPRADATTNVVKLGALVQSLFSELGKSAAPAREVVNEYDIDDDSSSSGSSEGEASESGLLEVQPPKRSAPVPAVAELAAPAPAPSARMAPAAGGGVMAAIAVVAAGSARTMAAATHAESWRLDSALVSALATAGVSSFFPVQAEVIPYLLAGLDDAQLGDVCVSAPTGSGKTLVYVLPILHAVLRSNGACGLYALVLLPTRELASQVAGVFTKYAAGTSARIGVLAGAHSFAAEEGVLGASHSGGAGGVHVLVATPGRLMDHLDHTPSTAPLLARLAVLVVDEADRLLAESYSAWVPRLRAALVPPTSGACDIVGRFTPAVDEEAVLTAVTSADLRSIKPFCARGRVSASNEPVGHTFVEPQGIRTGAGAVVAGLGGGRGLPTPAWLRPRAPGASGLGLPSPLPLPLRRIVCSATLTSNPQKLAALGLHQPLHFVSTADVAVASREAAPSSGVVDTRGDDGKRHYVLPSSLHHAQIVVTADNKPIALLQLVRMLEGQGIVGGAGAGGLRAIVFTNAVETAHRLCRLLQLFGGLQGRVVEFSAALTATQRSAVLAAASAGAISVLISSDAAARGLDLPHLPAVINYDAPPRIKTFVHRAGRTARAGREGVCYSLLAPEQARHFRLLTNRIVAARPGVEGAPTRVRVLHETLMDATIAAYAPRLAQVLARLQGVLEEEAAGKLLVMKPLLPLGTPATSAAVAS